MVTARLHDEARRILFDEAENLDAARAAAAKLTDATRRLFYVELEAQLAYGEISAPPSKLVETSLATISAASEPPISAIAPSEPSAPTSEPAYMEAKRRAIEAFEREYLSRVMAASNNSVTHAALAAGVERRNFRKMLQRHGLRPRGTRTTKAEPDAKYTDQILKILDENPQGLRTYEIAEKTKQTLSNAWGILKLLKRQERVERHGERYNTLWTLPGVTPVPRIETIPAAAVAVMSQTTGVMDARRLHDEISALLRAVKKPPTQAALNRGISRLVSNGTLAVHGANEHGAMYVLAQKGDTSNLN